MLIEFASNFPDKKLHFFTKINVCIFTHIEIISYLCSRIKKRYNIEHYDGSTNGKTS